MLLQPEKMKIMSNAEGIWNYMRNFDPSFLLRGYKKIPEILDRTRKDFELSQKIEIIIKKFHIPYSKGMIYYYIDKTDKSIIVFVPVKRRTLKVGRVLLDLEDELNKNLNEWRVEVWSKRYLNRDAWGIDKNRLREIKIK